LYAKPCLDCGKLTGGASRCEIHQKMLLQRLEAKRAERKRETGQYAGNYRKRAKQVRDSALYCHLCNEGMRIDDPFQADHLIPGDPNSPLAPAHRSCNARRGNKPLETNR
jgi:hypothetical protein